MKAMNAAKVEALKELIKKMRHLEAADESPDEPESKDEAAHESILDEALEPDMAGHEDDENPGKMVESDREPMSMEDEKRAFMTRSNRSPIRSKTKSVILAITAGKPKSMGKK